MSRQPYLDLHFNLIASTDESANNKQAAHKNGAASNNFAGKIFSFFERFKLCSSPRITCVECISQDNTLTVGA